MSQLNLHLPPSHLPTLGEDDTLKGLYFATGLSGHGFGIGPGVGRVMSDVLRGRPCGYDLARFRPTRFSDGSEIVPGPY